MAPHSVSECSSDADFSVVERLADTIRIGEEPELSRETHAKIVKDLYQGPRKCHCCINWVDEAPEDALEIDETHDEKDETGPPLVVRRRVVRLPTASVLSVHSIQVRHAATRAVLHNVFSGLDDLAERVGHLIFLAPFRPFFWRWERFERAIADEDDAEVRDNLVALRAIVKRELAGAFDVHKDLVPHGVISYEQVWTIFTPGDTVFSPDEEDGDRLYLLQSLEMFAHAVILHLAFVDCYGGGFTRRTKTVSIAPFRGTSRITSLDFFPVKHLPDAEAVLARLLERGRKFAALDGIHYKAYRLTACREGDEAPRTPGAERRIIVDMSEHPSSCPSVDEVSKKYVFRLHTGLISQVPIDYRPGGHHIPLQANPPPPQHVASYHNRSFKSFDSPRVRNPGLGVIVDDRIPEGQDDEQQDEQDEDDVPQLTDLQLQLCESRVLGYCLRNKAWRSFAVDRVEEIEWNSTPFESLVLPDGYKDLILAFVESKIKENDHFDDVINGKGGGLVILLSGSPGVGKTLTAESVAERMQVPLYKLDLSEYRDARMSSRSSRRRRVRSLSRSSDNSRSRSRSSNADRESGTKRLSEAFDLSSRWDSVLLIDECDLWLENRDSQSSKHHEIVSRFLRELEYYPSLLFLTTNRERALDPAVHSRIHLTINYPALDPASRLAIWKTFLCRGTGSAVSGPELAILAGMDLNGRRIRNVVKTANILAKREDRLVCFDDVRKVMKITENLELDDPVVSAPMDGEF